MRRVSARWPDWERVRPGASVLGFCLLAPWWACGGGEPDHFASDGRYQAPRPVEQGLAGNIPAVPQMGTVGADEHGSGSLDGVAEEGPAPVLLVTTPLGEVTRTSSASVLLRGSVYGGHAVKLTINGVAARVLHQTFSEKAALRVGDNHFSLVARDSEGRVSAVKRTLVREPALGAAHNAAASERAVASRFVHGSMPVLRVHTPPHAWRYTQEAWLEVSGHAWDEDFASVQVNGLVVGRAHGAFSASVHLEPDINVLSVVAQDVLGHETVVSRSVVLDQKAPLLFLDRPPLEEVYSGEYLISGLVGDQHLEGVALVRHPKGVSEILSVADGAFWARVRLEEGLNRFSVVASDKAGNRTERLQEVFFAAEPFVAVHSPLPPRGLVAWVDTHGVHLRWTPPRLLSTGQALPPGVSLRYRVVRISTEGTEGAPLGGFETDEPAYDGPPTPKASPSSAPLRFSVTAFLLGEQGQRLESEPSKVVALTPSQTVSLPPAGFFETPGAVTPPEEIAQRPAVVLTSVPGGVDTHLVYIRRKDHKTAGDELRYVQSERLGKDGSWSKTRPLITLLPTRQVAQVAVAAHKEHVVAAWIERELGSTESPGRSWVRAVVSEDGGKSFHPSPTTVRANNDWKRGIDVGIDSLGHVHLVWGESHRVYYVKDLQGPPENVFDETKRRVNDEVVHYSRAYGEQKCKGLPCVCAPPIDERYSLALEPDSSHENRPFGVYLLRTERAYVENPSLEVDDEKISIVAHQTRLFDHLPVPNPDWTAAKGPYVRPRGRPDVPDGCLMPGSIAHQRGFRRSWKKDGYACAPSPPDNEEALYARELRESGYAQGFQKAEDFYSYDHTRAHSRAWYSYLYEGTWDERDQIKVAQRPLEKGAWSEEQQKRRLVPTLVDDLVQLEPKDVRVETGWKQGTWQDGVLQKWRIHTVDTFLGEADEARGCDDASLALRKDAATGLSFPRIGSASDGTVVVVYEKGSSDDTHSAVGNPIEMSFLRPGDDFWSSPVTVATGHLPDLSIADDGTFAVVYRQGLANGRQVQVVRESLDTLGALVSVGDAEFEALPPPAPGDAPSEPDEEVSGPTGHGFVSIPVSRGPPSVIQQEEHGRGVDNLGGGPRVASHGALFLSTWVDSNGSPDERQIVSARALASGPRESRLVLTVPDDVVAHQVAPVVLECVDPFSMLSPACGEGDTGTTLDLAYGGSATESIAAVVAERAASEVSPSQVIWSEFSEAGTPLLASLAALEPASTELGSAPKLLRAPNAMGNYARAIQLRDELYSDTLGAQREYRGDVENHDSAHLARFDRVWAYTQGITLAQFARRNDARAAPLADFLCTHAKTGGGSKSASSGEPYELLGWPFSWNTNGDNWEDARLVTGANAWAVHGLGSYLSSRLFLQGLDPDSQSRIASCYFSALRGLKTHRRGGLMTAGYSTEGLKNAKAPHRLGLEENTGIEWAYYDILDAIGYAEIDEKNPPEVARCVREDDGTCTPIDARVLSAHAFGILKETARAENVVTEHNLDVLSVLNHALTHRTQLRPWLPPEDHDLFEQLDDWRQSLKDAVFEKLWDPQKRRFLTGGVFVDNTFQADNHTAIDNCSWLSLSVNYNKLNEQERTQLAECLEYTVESFVKELPFNGSVYRGTHYFPNSFSDPYIRQSDENEKLYHLEATAGLILGIRRFVDALPEHPKSQAFLDEADTLWFHMQRFVRDNGFPYSSRRIQDLMTLLESSTAVIWYIDVFDDDRERQRSLDRPLGNYARGVDYKKHAASVKDAWEKLQAATHGLGADRLFVPNFGERSAEDGLREPSDGVVNLFGYTGDFRVRLWIRDSGGEERLAISEVYALDATAPTLTEIRDVPINKDWMEVSVRAKRSPPEGWTQALNWNGALDEVSFVFEGRVHAAQLPNYRVMLSVLMDDREWFVGETLPARDGGFSLSYTEGDPGYPSLEVVGWTGDEGEVSGRPIARLVDISRGVAVASTGRWGYTMRPGWSFNHRFGGRHRYELVDVSVDPPKVVASADEGEISSGLLVSKLGEDPQERGVDAVTFVEDQALALMAGLSAPSVSGRYGRWVEGLMSTVHSFTAPGGTFDQFPFAVFSATGQPLAPYYQVGPQFLSIYAVSRQAARGPDYALGSVLERLADVVRSIHRLYGVGGEEGLFLSGGGDPAQMGFQLGVPPEAFASSSSEVAFPRFRLLSLQDHVYGAFALRELLGVWWGDENTRVFLEQQLAQVRQAIAAHFWDSDGAGRPLAFVWLHDDGRVAPPTASAQGPDEAAAAALYLLYGLEFGDPKDFDRTRRSLERLLQEWHRPSAPLTSTSVRRDFSQTFFFRALALRAAAAFDPRLDELAWRALEAWPESEGSDIPSWAGRQLVDNPAGVFGVRGGPMTFENRDRLRWMAHDGGPAMIEVRGRLQRDYAETLAALLMSDDHPHVFDALFHRLIQMAFVFGQYRDVVPLAEWPRAFRAVPYEERVLETVDLLQNLCQRSPSLLKRDEVATALGFGCEVAQDRFATVLKERLGPNEASALAMDIEHLDDEFDLMWWGRRVVRPAETTGPLRVPAPDGSFTHLGNLDALGGEMSPSVYDHLSKGQAATMGSSPLSLRAVWQDAVGAATDGRLGRYAVDGIDLIDLENRGAPEYWSRLGLEMRALLGGRLAQEVVLNDRVVAFDFATLLYGAREPSEAKDDEASGYVEPWDLQENVRLLRRFINTYYGGDLLAVASAMGRGGGSQLDAFSVHLMMRTGKLSEAVFDSMAQGAFLKPEELAGAKSGFVFVSPESPYFIKETSRSPVSSEDTLARHHALMGKGGVVGGEHAPVSALMNLRGPFFRTKPATHALKALANKLDGLLGLPPELATAATIVPALSYAASLGLEIDGGLLSIFVGRAPPDSERWEFVGHVRSQDLLGPIGGVFADENKIRAEVQIITGRAEGVDSRGASTVAFDDDRIYHVTADWFGVEDPSLGSYGVLQSEDDVFFEVHALKTSHTRFELIDASIRNHPRWKKAESWVLRLPESMQSIFLFWVGLSIEGEFGLEQAERIAADPASFRVGEGAPIVRAQGPMDTAGASSGVRLLPFDPIAGYFPIESDLQFVADQILVFYCSQDPQILDQIRIGSVESDVLKRQGRLAHVAIIDRNRRELSKKKELTPFEMGVFPFHQFDIDCRYVLRSLRKRELAALRDWAVTFRAFLNSLSVQGFAAFEREGQIDLDRLFAAFRQWIPQGQVFSVHPAIQNEFKKDLNRSAGSIPELIDILNRKIEGIPLDEQVTVARLPPFRLPTTFVNLKASFDAAMRRVMVSLDHPFGPAQVIVALYKKRRGRPGDHIEYVFRTEDGDTLYPAVWNPQWYGQVSRTRNAVEFNLGGSGLPLERLVSLLDAQRLASDGHTLVSTKSAISIVDSDWVKSRIAKETLLEFIRSLNDGEEISVTVEIRPDEVPAGDTLPHPKALFGELLNTFVDQLAYKTPVGTVPPKERPNRAPIVYSESVSIEGLSAGTRENSSSFGQEGAVTAVDGALSRVVLLKGKTVSKAASLATRFVDDMLRLPPELAATTIAGSIGVGHLLSLGTETGPGLETMFVGRDVPPDTYWRRVGTVSSDAVLAEPLRTYLKDEEDIRRSVPILTGGLFATNAPFVKQPSFDDARIYYIRSDWVGLETDVTGQVGFFAETENRLWDVYVLRSERSRADILAEFIKHHLLWQKAEGLSEMLPAPFRDSWLFLVELAIRGDFDRAGAERYATGVRGALGGVQTYPRFFKDSAVSDSKVEVPDLVKELLGPRNMVMEASDETPFLYEGTEHVRDYALFNRAVAYEQKPTLVRVQGKNEEEGTLVFFWDHEEAWKAAEKRMPHGYGDVLLTNLGPERDSRALAVKTFRHSGMPERVKVIELALKAKNKPGAVRFFSRGGGEWFPFFENPSGDLGLTQWADGYYSGKTKLSDDVLRAMAASLGQRLIRVHHTQGDFYSVFPFAAPTLHELKTRKFYHIELAQLAKGWTPKSISDSLVNYLGEGQTFIRVDNPDGQSSLYDLRGEATPFLDKADPKHGDGKWWAPGYYSGVKPVGLTALGREAEQVQENLAQIVHKDGSYAVFPVRLSAVWKSFEEGVFVLSGAGTTSSSIRTIATTFAVYGTNDGVPVVTPPDGRVRLVRKDRSHISLGSVNYGFLEGYDVLREDGTWRVEGFYSGASPIPVKELYETSERLGLPLVEVHFEAHGFFAVFVGTDPEVWTRMKLPHSLYALAHDGPPSDTETFTRRFSERFGHRNWTRVADKAHPGGIPRDSSGKVVQIPENLRPKPNPTVSDLWLWTVLKRRPQLRRLLVELSHRLALDGEREEARMERKLKPDLAHNLLSGLLHADHRARLLQGVPAHLPGDIDEEIETLARRQWFERLRSAINLLVSRIDHALVNVDPETTPRLELPRTKKKDATAFLQAVHTIEKVLFALFPKSPETMPDQHLLALLGGERPRLSRQVIGSTTEGVFTFFLDPERVKLWLPNTRIVWDQEESRETPFKWEPVVVVQHHLPAAEISGAGTPPGQSPQKDAEKFLIVLLPSEFPFKMHLILQGFN